MAEQRAKAGIESRSSQLGCVERCKAGLVGVRAVLAFVFALAVRPLEGPFLIGIVQSVFIIFARGSFFSLVSYFLYLSLFFLYICVGLQR